MNKVIVATYLSRKVSHLEFNRLNEDAGPKDRTARCYFCNVEMTDATLNKATIIARLNGLSLREVIEASI